METEMNSTMAVAMIALVISLYVGFIKEHVSVYLSRIWEDQSYRWNRAKRGDDPDMNKQAHFLMTTSFNLIMHF